MIDSGRKYAMLNPSTNEGKKASDFYVVARCPVSVWV
jgi:hypothetical protein